MNLVQNKNYSKCFLIYICLNKTSEVTSPLFYVFSSNFWNIFAFSVSTEMRQLLINLIAFIFSLQIKCHFKSKGLVWWKIILFYFSFLIKHVSAISTWNYLHPPGVICIKWIVLKIMYLLFWLWNVKEDGRAVNVPVQKKRWFWNDLLNK